MFEFSPYPKSRQLKENRRAKHRGDRSKFSKFIRDEVKKHFDNTCQMCGGHGLHVHHVMPRGSGVGRGVFTNALLLCNECHKKVHSDDSLLRYWKEVYRKRYGPLYFMDADDLKMKCLKRELHKEDQSLKEWKKYNGKLDLRAVGELEETSDKRRDAR